MNSEEFAEKMKFDTKNWFYRGVGHRRDDNEIISYLEGVESATLQALEALGKYSIAVYQANTIGGVLDDYIYNELLEMKEDENA